MSSFNFSSDNKQLTLIESDIPSQPLLVLIDLNDTARSVASKYAETLTRDNNARNRNLFNWANRWVNLSDYYIALYLNNLADEARSKAFALGQLITDADRIIHAVDTATDRLDQLNSAFASYQASIQRSRDSIATYHMLTDC